MKTKRIFLFVLSAVMLLVTSCGDDKKGDDPNPNPTPNPNVLIESISITSSLNVFVGDFSTLTANLMPTNAGGTVTWTSSNPAVATVDPTGKMVKVTGVSAGTTNIVATGDGKTSNTCVVTVTEQGEYVTPVTTAEAQAALNGSEYYVIMLDGTSIAALETRLGANYHYIGTLGEGSERPLYIWPETPTFSFGTTVGANIFGLAQEWWSCIPTPGTTWTGAGIALEGPIPAIGMNRITENPNEWYFHMAIKAGTANSARSALFSLGAGTGNEVQFAIGEGFYDDQKGITIHPVGEPTRDGRWNRVEFPISELLKDEYRNPSFAFSSGVPNGNLFSWLFGADPNTLDIDAIFIYKK